MGDNDKERLRRLAFARWRAGLTAGKAAISTAELTERAIQAGFKKVDLKYAGRIESGERPLILEWARALADVAEVDAGWLLMFENAPEPPEYQRWLAGRLAEERAAEEAAKTKKAERPKRKVTPPIPRNRKDEKRKRDDRTG